MREDTFDFGALRSALHHPDPGLAWSRACAALEHAHQGVLEARADDITRYVRGVMARGPGIDAWCPARWMSGPSPLRRLATHFAVDDADALSALLLDDDLRVEGLQLTGRIDADTALSLLESNPPAHLRHLEVYTQGMTARGTRALARLLETRRARPLHTLCLGGAWFEGVLDVASEAPVWNTRRVELVWRAAPPEALRAALMSAVASPHVDALALNVEGRVDDWVAPHEHDVTRRARPLTLELIGMTAFGDDVDALARAPSGVSALILVGCTLGGRALERLLGVQGESLRRLVLDACVLPEGSQPLLALEHTPGLRRLELPWTRQVVGQWVPSPAELDVLMALPGLESVTWPRDTRGAIDAMGHACASRLPGASPDRHTSPHGSELALLSDDGQFVPLADRSAWAIGRDPALDVVFDDRHVSRTHALVYPLDDGVAVLDVSKNGAHSTREGWLGPMDVLDCAGRQVRLLAAPPHELERMRVRYRPNGALRPRPRLVCASSGHEVRILGSITTMGRADGSDVHVEHRGVSRQHAQILRIKDDYVLRDLDSSSGTFLNGERIQGLGRPLRDGDVVALTSVEFVYRR